MMEAQSCLASVLARALQPRRPMSVSQWCDEHMRLTTYDGAQMRAFGQLQLAIPYNVWVRSGRLVEAAPNLPLIELSV